MALVDFCFIIDYMNNETFNLNIDPYSPQEMAEKAENVGVKKANLAFFPLLILGILAGVFIGFGAALFILITHNSFLSFGLTQILGGLAFSCGLIFVVVSGAELFTGNNLLTMAFADKKITFRQLARNWIIVYSGNLIGAVGLALLFDAAGVWETNGGLFGVKAVSVAAAKTSLPLLPLFVRAVLANTLVCLAVWLSYAGRSVVDKMAGIALPITAFVALGFEHSIANMFFIAAGRLAKMNPLVSQKIISLSPAIDLTGVNLDGFVYNIFWSTLGNIFGGAVLVGLVYWFLYLRSRNN